MEKREFEARILASSIRYYRIAKAMLRNDADCEDAMQEAMLNAWKHLPSLKNHEYFDTWLCRILINECKRQIRRSRRKQTDPLLESYPAPQPPEPLLWEALQRLDSRYRLPLTMHHANGNTLEETARILGLPVSTVKWRVHRGKQLLSNLLEKENAL